MTDSVSVNIPLSQHYTGALDFIWGLHSTELKRMPDLERKDRGDLWRVWQALAHMKMVAECQEKGLTHLAIHEILVL